MNKIIQFKDKEGGLYPITVGEAVFVGEKALTQVLQEIKPKDTATIPVMEAGLYVCDANGHYIAQFAESGLDTLLSPDAIGTIKNELSKDEVVLDGQTKNAVCIYRRLTDSGYISSKIYSSFVFAGDLNAGSHTITFQADNFLLKDYFRFDSNAPTTLTNVVWRKKEIEISFSVPVDCRDVTLQISYATIDENTHDKVTVKVKSAATGVVPAMATVKYNKRIPVCYISDDMGLGDFSTIWCLFNGYPVGEHKGTANIRGEQILNGVFGASMYPAHEPLTYTDNTGGVRRYAISSAIWANALESTNYTKINKEDIPLMMRTGHSFCYHDVSSNKTIADCVNSFKLDSNLFKQHIGQGLKVMVEPSGAKKYVMASILSGEVCMPVSQASGEYMLITFDNGTQDYLNYNQAVAAGHTGPKVYFSEYNLNINTWAGGRDYVSYRQKQPGSVVRAFVQGNADTVREIITNADGTKALFFGNHGIDKDICDFFVELAQTRDDIWFCSADEFWEYYHLVNNTIVGDVVCNGEDIAMDFFIPNPTFTYNIL